MAREEVVKRIQKWLRKRAQYAPVPRTRGAFYRALSEAHVQGEDYQRLKIAKALREQASLRFDEVGPRDERGAALWDAAVGIEEGTLP